MQISRLTLWVFMASCRLCVPFDKMFVGMMNLLCPSAESTASCPLRDDSKLSRASTFPWIIFRFGLLILTFPGFRTSAVITCPRSSPCSINFLPVLPVPPTIKSFMIRCLNKGWLRIGNSFPPGGEYSNAKKDSPVCVNLSQFPVYLKVGNFKEVKRSDRLLLLRGHNLLKVAVQYRNQSNIYNQVY